jgi:hypothetical protein
MKNRPLSRGLAAGVVTVLTSGGVLMGAAPSSAADGTSPSVNCKELRIESAPATGHYGLPVASGTELHGDFCQAGPRVPGSKVIVTGGVIDGVPGKWACDDYEIYNPYSPVQFRGWNDAGPDVHEPCTQVSP